MLRSPWSRLGIQIVAAISFAVAITGAITFWRIDDAVGDDTAEHFADQVQRATLQAEERLDTYSQLVQTGAVVLASRPDLRAAMAADDLTGSLVAATALLEETSLPIPGIGRQGITLYDEHGTLLIRAHAPFNQGTSGSTPEVQRALDGAPVRSARIDEVLGVTLAGLSPVYGPDGELAGVIETMASLDDSFARTLAGLVGTRVAVLGNDGSGVSSEPGWLPTLGEIEPIARAEHPYYVSIGDEEFLAMSTPIQTPGGAEPVGSIYLGIARSLVVGAQGEAGQEVLLSTALAMAIGIAAAGALGLFAIRPLRGLVTAARRIQANDLEQPVPVSGPREVRDLASALDEMRLTIRDTREDLVRINRGLTQRVAASTSDLSAATLELSVMHQIVAQLSGGSGGGLPAVPEELTRLEWVDGAFVALADASGGLSRVSEADMPVDAAHVVLQLLRSRSDALTSGYFVSDTGEDDGARVLQRHGVGGLALVPLISPGGVAGIIAVVSTAPMALPESRRFLLQSIANEVLAAVERAELQEAAQESRALAASVLRDMSDGVVLLDADGRCQVCNPAASDLLGVQPATVIGRLAEAWLPLDISMVEALRNRVRQPGQATAPLVVTLHDRQLALSVAAYQDPGTTEPGMILLIRDLTVLAEAERVKQDFVSMVGHELRTPLTMIRTGIDLLNEDAAGDLSATQQRIVDVLRNNSDRLLRLINDLLDMSALDSGQVRVRPASMDLGEIVVGLVETFRAEAEDRDITLRIDTPGGSVPAWADRDRVQQVLANLVGNGLKYTPQGGGVTVRIVPELEMVRVEVQDTGIGIPPAEQAQLFEKFYRTQSGRRQSGGTGLGLAIARSIVELHGGEIWCESDGTNGSTFSFTLPARRPLAAMPGT